MKRWFSLLLALALACVQMSGPMARAFAEESTPEVPSAEILEAAAEDATMDAEPQPVEEVTLDEGAEPEADEALDTVLEADVVPAPLESVGEEMVVDLVDVTAEDVEEASAGEPEVEEPAFAVCYARVGAEEAPVYAGAEDAEPFAFAGAGAVVLLPEGADTARVRAAFDTEMGVVEGWMDEGFITSLTDDEISTYMDDAAMSGPVSLYGGDPNMPMLPAACRFATEEDAKPGEEEAAQAPEEDAAEPVEGLADEDTPAEDIPGDGDEPEAPTEEPEAVTEPEASEGETGDASEPTEEPADETGTGDGASEAEAAEDEIVEAPETCEDAASGNDAGEGMISFEDLSFKLNAERVELAVGQSWTIEAEDAEGNAIPAAELTFTNNSNNVSVDAASGMVTAIYPGSARITVACGNERRHVDVTVLSRPESIAVYPESMVIGAGLESSPIQVAFEAGTGAQYTFTSSDESVAQVDENGVVYGLAEGTAIIRAVVSDTVSADCAVTVEKAPERITLDVEELLVGEGDDSCHLTAEVPQDAHQEPLTWESSNASVVSVDGDGNLTAKKASEEPVTITVKTYNKMNAKCSVIVANAPAKVKLGAKLTMYKGQVRIPDLSVLDANNGDCAVAKVRFNSSDKSVVTVSSSGKLTARGVGKATITATAYNGVAASMVVTVKPEVNGLTLTPKAKPTTGYLGVGQVVSGWKVTLSPNGAYAYSYTYSSTNSSVLKVLDSKTGKFKAMKKGTAYIKVTSANGKTAKYKFVVRKAPTKVALSPANGRLKVGQSARYRFNLYGAGGSYAFTSSNPKVATVSANGKVKALKKGTTRITLRTYNGKKKTVTLRVYSKSYAGMPNYLASDTSGYRSNMTREEKLEYVIYVAQNKLGCRYVWGSFGPNTFDCSGFTYYCFSKIGVRMQNSAYRQGYLLGGSKRIRKIGNLRRGDVVCFNTSNDGDRCDHVGIYLGNGYFIHASSSAHKVIISQFVSRSSNYYKRNFSWGIRVKIP